MKSATTAALACLLAVANAHYSHNWGTDSCFPRPGNTDNRCSEHQHHGYDWSGLSHGPFSSFDGLDFSGFSCSDRSGSGRRSYNGGSSGKCIEGKLGHNSDSSPSISCGHGKSGFSISDFHFSTSEDTDVHIHYHMPDGSTCKQVSPCSKHGTRARNDQCGGATSVSFHLPDDDDGDRHGNSRHGGDRHDDDDHDDDRHGGDGHGKDRHGGRGCHISIHSIGFDCTPATTTGGVPTQTAVPSETGVSPVTSTPAVEPSSSAPVPVSTPAVSPSESASVQPSVQPSESASVQPSVQPSESASVQPSVQPSGSASVQPSVTPSVQPSESASVQPSVTPSVSTPVQMTTSTVYSTVEVTVTSCAPTVTNCPAHSTTVVTSTIAVSTTVCPVTETPSSAGAVPSSAAPSPSGSSPALTTPAPSSAAPASSLPVGDVTTTVVTYETVTYCPVTSTITSGGSEVVTTFTTASTVTTSSVATVPVTPTPIPSAPCPNSVPKCINTWLTLLPKCDSNSDASCFCPSSEFTDKVISCIQAWGASDEEVQAALSYFTGICGSYVPQNPGIVTAIPTTITLVPTVAPTGVEAQGSQPAVTEAPCTTITYSSYTVTVPQVQFTTATSGPSETVGLVPVVSTTQASSRPVIPTGFATAAGATPSGAASVPAPSSPPVFDSSASGLTVTASAGLLATVVAAVFGFLL